MRKVLTFALAILFLAAMPAATALTDESHSAGQGIEGTWLSVVYFPDGTPLIQFLHSFTKDGRTTCMLPSGPDPILPPDSPPLEPPTVNLGDSRSGCTGEWRYAGRRTFDVTMYCLWRQNPGVDPDRIRFKLTLDRSGNSLKGPFKYLYSDLLFPPGAAGVEVDLSLKSTRLDLVPLE
jgi:hypothetical protein